MRYIYNFNLQDVVNIDNYYEFLEVYLKENNIKKKEFFEKTSICPNSYRFFFRNKGKNKVFYYEIISRQYNLIIPSEDDLADLSGKFSKIVEDILYKRTDKLEEDNKIIESVKMRNNPNLEDKICSLEGLFFEMLSGILNTSLKSCSFSERYNFLEKSINLTSKFKSLITEEYDALYLLSEICLSGWQKRKFEYKIPVVQEHSRNYQFLKPLFNKTISDAYYAMGDYVNTIVYALKAYDDFIQTTNFQRAISTKINIAYTFLIMGSYLNANETLYELYLSYHVYNGKQRNSILRGLIESYILLGKFNDAYDFIEINMDDIARDELFIEYMIILYKLKKKDQFIELFEYLMAKWENNNLYELYYYIILGLYNNYFPNEEYEKIYKENRKKLEKLNNVTFFKICKLILK